MKSCIEIGEINSSPILVIRKFCLKEKCEHFQYNLDVFITTFNPVVLSNQLFPVQMLCVSPPLPLNLNKLLLGKQTETITNELPQHSHEWILTAAFKGETVKENRHNKEFLSYIFLLFCFVAFLHSLMEFLCNYYATIYDTQ